MAGLRLKKPYINKEVGFVFKNFNYTYGTRLVKDGIAEWIDDTKTAKAKKEPTTATAAEKPKRGRKKKQAEKE